MSDQSENVNQFKAITGADEERAKFYLSSAADQLEVRVKLFFCLHIPSFSLLGSYSKIL